MKSKFLLVYVFVFVAVIGFAALGTAVSSVASISSAAEKQTFEKQFKVAESTAQTAKPFTIGTFKFSSVSENPRVFAETSSAKYYPCETDRTSVKNFDLRRSPDIFTKTKFGDNNREKTFIFARNQNAFEFGLGNRRFVRLE